MCFRYTNGAIYGGSEWVRTIASGFSVQCTTTIYTTDPKMVVMDRFGLPTFSMSTRRSNQLSYTTKRKLVDPAGLEPATRGL